MRRLQIYIDESLDDSLGSAARKEGVSKAALIRRAVAKELGPTHMKPADGWAALTGWLDDDPVDDIDSVIYGSRQ